LYFDEFMKISLVGYMGSGKSVVGKALATKLNLEFFDLDQQIQDSAGMTIPELFKQYGEIKFRKLERELLLQTLESRIGFVLALGGGTPVYYDNMKQVNTHSTSFYLRSNLKFLAERLEKEKSKRPLIAHLKDEELPEFIAKHLFERRNFYEQAHHTVDIGSKSVDEITQEIIHLLNLQK